MGSVKNVKIIGFFDISLDILHEMKENFGQEHVKKGPLSFQGKNRNNFPAIPGKMTVFPVLALLFHPSLPPKQNQYIFEISDNRAIR